MTPEQLQTIRERWKWLINAHNHLNGIDEKSFIAHARTDIPALLDEVESLQNALKEAEE